jgi:hypothetical protein
MPPRSSLTSSFSVSDANNEVVCPLRNQDGSSCRKRCLGVSSLCFAVSAVPLLKLFRLCSHHRPPMKKKKNNCGNKRLGCAGKTISVYARAYSSSSPRTLHLQASRDRGELPAHDQYPAIAATATAKLQPSSPRSVQPLWAAGTITDKMQVMETNGTATMARIPAPRIPRGTWKSTSRPRCCQPLALLQLSHSYTITNMSRTGSRKGSVMSKSFIKSRPSNF